VIGREDFTFTIGYSGNTAIVDGSLKRRFRSPQPGELARQGLFKAALCCAVYDGKDEELRTVLEEYNRQTPRPLRAVEELKRTFGVFEVPADIAKVIVV